MPFWKTLVSSVTNEAPKGSKSDERRRLKPDNFGRPQRLKEGYLWADALIMPRACTIRHMSPLTAEIVLWHDDVKPHILKGALKLYSSADGKEADCVVASRDGNVLSLRLMSAFRAPSRKYA